MIAAEKTKEYLIPVAPFLKLNIKCAHVKPRVNNTGSKAGYILKLAIKSPLSNSIKDRCMPQPGQSIPNNCL